MCEYYEITHEVEIENRWYLAEINDASGNELDPHLFQKGNTVTITQPLFVRPNQIGRPLDFTLTAFGVPIVSNKLGDIIYNSTSNLIQRIPVTIEPNVKGFEIINILKTIKCLDYNKTFVQRYDSKFGDPSLIGKVQFLSKITIEPVNPICDIFRLDEWKIIAIISGRLREILHSPNLTGMIFNCVCRK